MNLKISGLFSGIALVALSSCSSAYKSGQTPDDVYYSPGKARVETARQEEYLETNPKQERYRQENNDDYYYGNRDDRYMRMMIASGRRPWFYNDFAMMDPWMYNDWRWNSYMTWNSGFNSPWNSMYYWNSFYNPYCNAYYPYYPYGGKGYYGSGYNYHPAPSPSRPVSAFSMSSYLNTNSSSNRNTYRPGRSYGGNYNNSNSNRNYNPGYNNRRSSFGGNEGFNNAGSERSNRSYSPSSSSGSSSSRSSSSNDGGGVSRPARRGN